MMKMRSNKLDGLYNLRTNNQTNSPYDPADYHAEGPVPVGHAVILHNKPEALGIPERPLHAEGYPASQA